MRTFKKILSILGTIFLVILIAVVILMFNARISGEAPEVFGYQIFRVSSGSMEPELMIGDVIVVKSVDASEVNNGDIVTYKGEQGDLDDKFITHKVIAEPEYIDGEYVFTTKGVAQGAVTDPQWYEDQLVGVFVCKLPFINAVYNFFLQPYGLIVFVLVIIVLFGYELISLIVSYKTIDELEDEDEDKDNDENNSDKELKC